MKDRKSLSRKIGTLVSNKSYENPVITSEGYGTFMPANDSQESTLAQAKALKDDADRLDNKDSVLKLMESFFLYLRAHSMSSTTDLKAYLNMKKFMVRLLEHIAAQAKRFDLPEYLPALEWGLFNIRLIRLFKETELLARNPDLSSYTYVLDMLRRLNVFYGQNSSNPIEVVEIKELENGIKKRLPK